MSYSPKTISAVLRDAAQNFGEQSAIVDNENNISFKTLDSLCDKAAAACMAAGLEKNQCAAIWAPNIFEWIVAAIGIQRARGILVPLNTRFKGAEAAYILNKTRAKILFTLRGFLDVDYPALLEKQTLPSLEHIVLLRGEKKNDKEKSWSDFLAPVDTAQKQFAALSPDDIGDILFTSGTTSAPKGVMTTHQQTIKTFENWCDAVGLKKTDRYLITAPFFHSFGYKAGWLACLLRGATIFPHAVFDPKEIMARIEKERISVLPGPPTIFQSMLDHPDFKKYDLSSLRMTIVGGAVVPVELVKQMKTTIGFDVVLTGYGLTESCGVVSLSSHDDDFEAIATSCGRAMKNVEVKCVDDSGQSVPRGESGEIWVRGFNVMKGYFEDEPATKAALTPEGWLLTGDIGMIDEDNLLHIIDRKKDIFISGGFNCSPAEIEAALMRHDSIAECAVIGTPDKRMGEVGAAFIVLLPHKTLTADELTTWCREQMANYKVPRKIYFVASLPRNASGKVQKFLLAKNNA